MMPPLAELAKVLIGASKRAYTMTPSNSIHKSASSVPIRLIVAAAAAAAVLSQWKLDSLVTKQQIKLKLYSRAKVCCKHSQLRAPASCIAANQPID